MIYLGQPSYGNISAMSAKAYYLASRRPDVHRQLTNCSLLAMNFNTLWAGALNRGAEVEYFAMLHADCEPQDYWLDAMIEELEAKELDVLSAVVPIKDHKGLTSTAIERSDGDAWRPRCRLTMQDVFNLPETFTAEDVGAPLLLNTGCWVCKWDMDWATQVHFEINDRIAYNDEQGKFFVEVEPEDWNFSRQCNALGLKLGATRKIRLSHQGSMGFVNDRPWGHYQFDNDFLQQEFIKRGGPEGFRFPYDVEGWLLPQEGAALAELAADKRVLEIGSYCGKSTICMAQTAEHVTTIDPGDGRATPMPKHCTPVLEENLGRYSLLEKVTLSTERVGGEYDFVFIDGDHSYEAVKSDIDYALSVLKPGGLLAFHDFRDTPGQFDGSWDPGVTQAVNEFISGGNELLNRYATVALVKPQQVLQGA